MRQLPPSHPNQDNGLKGESVPLQFHLVIYRQTFFLHLFEEVRVRFDVLSHRCLQPNILEGVIFDAENVFYQNSAIGELTLSEVALRVRLEACIFY